MEDSVKHSSMPNGMAGYLAILSLKRAAPTPSGQVWHTSVLASRLPRSI